MDLLVSVSDFDLEFNASLNIKDRAFYLASFIIASTAKNKTIMTQISVSTYFILFCKRETQSSKLELPCCIDQPVRTDR